MQKYTKYIIAGVVVIVFIALAVYSRQKMSVSKSNDLVTQNQVNNLSESTTTVKAVSTTPVVKNPSTLTTAPKVVPVKKPVISKTAAQSYIDASAKYKKSGYYIQFYPCQATPGSLIVKQGSKIMLDNRDSKAHSIGIKNDKYLIASYNYAIATLNNIGTNYVTCDGGGSATVTVVP